MNDNAEMTVMVVEDERIVAVMAKAMLENLGYKVVLCSDGATAIDTFARRHDEIRLVLLDMILPDMDGRKIYQALRDVDPELTCLISSGFAVTDPIKDVLDEGANGFIQKPFKLQDLKAKLDALLGR